MTPRPSFPLSRLLRARYASDRQALVLRASLRAAATGAAGIALAVIAGALFTFGEPASWVRLGFAIATVVLGLALAVRGFLAVAPRYNEFLERLEQRFPEIRSWLRNALEFEQGGPAHGSAELAHAVSSETATRLAVLPLETTRPRIEPKRPAALIAAATLGLVALTFLSPPRARYSWSTLLDPRLAAPPVRLAVEPGSVRISPGASLSVRARVWGTARRPAILRPGSAAVTAAYEGSGDGGARVWRFDLSQLTSNQTYRVRVAHTASPEYRIELAGEPAAVSFEIEYVAPAYARLPVQHGAATRGDLSALTGTRARIVATFDRDLRAVTATIAGAKGSSWTPVTPRRWSGEVPILSDGEYELHATATSGEARMRYRVSALPDAPPVLAVQLPTGDLDLPAGQQIPLSVLAQDDLGLARLKLQIRRDSDSTWRSTPLAEFAAHPREASASSSWDASVLGLLPGETASFRFEVEDDNVLTGPGRAQSPTFQLRFPGVAELYENIDRAQGSTREVLEKAAEQAREVQKSLDHMARMPEAQRSQPSPNSFEHSEELKSTLQRQQDLGQKIDEAANQLRQTLEQAAEREAFNEELMTKLREMTDLVKQIQSPEFKDALKRMQEAMEKMDRRQLDQSIPQWREQNKQLLEQLKRTLDLLKQMRQEEQLQAMAQRARELKEQQDAMNREHAASKAQDAQNPTADRQDKAADQTDKLSQDAKQLASEVENPADQQKLEQASKQLAEQAAPHQRQAAQSSRSHQSQQAKQQGEQASEELQQASEGLDQLAQESQSRRREVDLAAVRRAAQDLVSLQREGERTLASEAPPAERGDRQTDLSDGVSRVADSLFILAKQQPFISPKLGASLGRAIQSLQESGRQLGSGNVPRGEGAGRQGGTALNEAILELRATEGKMGSCQKPGGQKPGGRTSEAMGEIGKRQADLNQETRNMTQRLSEQMRLSAGDQARMREMATEQRRLREQLEQMQRDEETRRELLGHLDATQKEMKETEEVLQRGELGEELEQKQQHILSRLLDAQRSVNRRDFDPQRESRSGEDIARLSPAELPADLLRANDRLRLDLLKAQSDRYPAQYRAYVEAYLKSLNQLRTTPAR